MGQAALPAAFQVEEGAGAFFKVPSPYTPEPLMTSSWERVAPVGLASIKISEAMGAMERIPLSV